MTGSPGKGSFSGGKLTRDTDDGFSYDPKWDKLAKDYVKETQNQYKNSLGGKLGDFLGKCKVAKKHIADLNGVDNGLVAHTTSGGSRNWNKKFNSTINQYVSQKVHNASVKFKKSWSRQKRGSGPIEFGKPLAQGKEKERDGISINMAFYVDTSGSMMGDPIKNCCKAVNAIANNIDKHYIKNPVVAGTSYTAYSFDTHFHKETMPLDIPARSANNIDLDELLAGMQEKTQTSMINVILTDAEFPVPVEKCISLVKKFPGLLVFVINNTGHHNDYKEIEKKCKNFIYIEADDEFAI